MVWKLGLETRFLRLWIMVVMKWLRDHKIRMWYFMQAKYYIWGNKFVLLKRKGTIVPCAFSIFKETGYSKNELNGIWKIRKIGDDSLFIIEPAIKTTCYRRLLFIGEFLLNLGRNFPILMLEFIQLFLSPSEREINNKSFNKISFESPQNWYNNINSEIPLKCQTFTFPWCGVLN